MAQRFPWLGRGLGAFVVVLVALVWLNPASATIVLKLDAEGLTSSADLVLVGKVESQRSRWEGTRIVTEIDVRVAVPVMGQLQEGSLVRVQTLGGRVDDLAQVVSGVTQFAPNEEVVLFLNQSQNQNKLQVVGLAQGKYHIYRGPDERLWATQNLQGLTLATPTGKDERGRTMAQVDHESETHKPEPVRLEDLLRTVGHTMQKLEVPLHASFKARMGTNLDRSHDFSLDLKKLVHPQTRDVPSFSPPTKSTPQTPSR